MAKKFVFFEKKMFFFGNVFSKFFFFKNFFFKISKTFAPIKNLSKFWKNFLEKTFPKKTFLFFFKKRKFLFIGVKKIFLQKTIFTWNHGIILWQCWRNRTIWQTSIWFFSCQKRSKITKYASVLLKQHKRKKQFLGRKKLKWQYTSQQKVQTDTPTKIFSQKCSNLTFLGGFSNFQNWIFLSFLVSHKKNFFFVPQTYFCFSKKIYRLVSQIQPKF